MLFPKTFPLSLETQFRVHELGMILFAFSFPLFQKALPILGALLGVNALLYLLRRPSPLGSFFQEKRGKGLLFAMAGFYLLHGIGILYSEDLGNAFFDLQKKLGFLFFPLLIATMPSLSSRRLFQLLMAFVAGAFLVSCLGFVQALGNYWSRTDPWIGYLYGKYFAFGIHRTYLAVYLLFASCVLVQFIRHKEGGIRGLNGKLASFSLGFLLVAVFMTASRAAILALPLLMLLFVLDLKEFALWKRVGIYLGILLMGFGALFLFPRSQERMEKSFQKVRALVFQGEEAEGDGSARRLRVWEVARGVFAEHLWTGVGTGDDRNVLVEAYRRKGYEGLFADRLDAHSQYLQTGIALGLPGLFLLLTILIQGWRIGRKRSPLLGQLVLILFLMAFFESVLERQAGILFFAFFMPLIAIREGREEERAIWKEVG